VPLYCEDEANKTAAAALHVFIMPLFMSPRAYFYCNTAAAAFVFIKYIRPLLYVAIMLFVFSEQTFHNALS